MNVLIVDDSVVFRTAIKTAVLSHPDVDEVKAVSNGKIAVDILKSQSFNAVTLDLEMPVMDGNQTIKEIRKFNKNIPIVIFSSQSVEGANKTLRALELGADDFVQKVESTGDT
jgi:two-component system chemotaxis response regulator CheB